MSDKDYTKGVDLVSENQILAENLEKCVEEKNFVWSLWKKLQTEKPDLSSVVSLVMAREKEKTELRDSKVLNILENKDIQINQLELGKDEIINQLRQKEEEVESYGLRLHDLLIEKANLQESLEKVKDEHEERTKVLVEENGYLSEVVRARQLQHENDGDKYKAKLDDVDKERKELHKVVTDLEFRLDKLNEDKFMNSAIVEENDLLKDQLKSCQDELTTLTKEHEDAISTLKLRESQLQKHSNVTLEQKELLRDKDNLLVALRNEINEIKLAHGQCPEYAKEQSTLIENLQSLQEQTTSVIKVQEDKFKSEITALKEQLIEKEKANDILENTTRQLSQECDKCCSLEQELQKVKERSEELLDVSQQKNRRISSLEKTLTAKNDQNASNLHQHNTSYSSTLERKCKTAEQKMYELQKVLEFKQQELDALSSAHSNRLERYKNLQQEHKIVLKQLKTYENSSDEEARRQESEEPIPRASPRSLQKENSDSVWNELQHYKREYETLLQERDDVMEEVDVLRVERANDVTTIHELRMCLEDEKRDLVEEIKFNNATEKDGIKKDIKRLEKEKNNDIKQMESLKKDYNLSEKETETLKNIVREQEETVEKLETEVSKYKKEVKSMKSKEKKRVEREKRDKEEKKNEEKNEQKDANTQNSCSKDKEENTGISMSSKQIQTDVTYEEQLHEATKQMIMEATRDSILSQHRQLTHRYTQTSPVKTTGEPSFLHGNIEGVSSDSVASEVSEKQADVSTQSKYVTPSRKIRNRTQSPIHREWKIMRQRVLSLTKQVASLKTSKESLTKSTNEQKLASEKLQNDLSQCQQRLKLSKQAAERLTKELEENTMKNQELAKSQKEYKVPAYPTEKHLQDRLKLSSNECSRLSCELKSSRKLCGELEEKLKSFQERCTRQDHLLTQKKVFVEDMKSKLKTAQESLESTLEELKCAEEKAIQRKNQIDAVKRQLDMEIGHRQKFETLYEQNEEELKKKAQLLAKAQALRHEAELAVNEMEEAAKRQLHNLANQSHVTLKSIEMQLMKSRQNIEEFKIVVRALAEELIQRVVSQKVANKQEHYNKNESVKNKASMLQACELAGSILNMSKADIDDLLDVEDEGFSVDSEEEWKTKIEQELSKQGSFSEGLVQTLLGIIDNLTNLQQNTTHQDET